MNWFELLKVDIDFDKEIGAMGQYGEGIGVESREDMDRFLEKLMRDMIFQSKRPDIKEYLTENIKINHQRINAFLKEKMLETIGYDLEADIEDEGYEDE